MNSDRFFMDTAFVLALLNSKDAFHKSAKEFFFWIRSAQEVWLHDGILIEVANGMSDKNRLAAADFIDRAYKTANTKVVPLNRKLLKRAVKIYRERQDKEWGLTDCISFIVMQDQGLTDALTNDHHFQQAGFKVLLKDNK